MLLQDIMNHFTCTSFTQWILMAHYLCCGHCARQGNFNVSWALSSKLSALETPISAEKAQVQGVSKSSQEPGKDMTNKVRAELGLEIWVRNSWWHRHKTEPVPRKWRLRGFYFRMCWGNASPSRIHVPGQILPIQSFSLPCHEITETTLWERNSLPFIRKQGWNKARGEKKDMCEQILSQYLL